MTRKSSEGMPGALPSTAYFVQDEMQWPSNEMGKKLAIALDSKQIKIYW